MKKVEKIQNLKKIRKDLKNLKKKFALQLQWATFLRSAIWATTREWNCSKWSAHRPATTIYVTQKSRSWSIAITWASILWSTRTFITIAGWCLDINSMHQQSPFVSHQSINHQGSTITKGPVGLFSMGIFLRNKWKLMNFRSIRSYRLHRSCDGPNDTMVICTASSASVRRHHGLCPANA